MNNLKCKRMMANAVEYNLKEMATMSGVCLTSGANYSTVVQQRSIGVNVQLPMDLNVNEEEAIALEQRMHNALEAILKDYFRD